MLLGEASHGTHEYYTWRAKITRRLIEEKGFSFVAVEGDWPDAYQINRWIKGYPDAGDRITDVLRQFRRWPTWMWANWEIAALGEWMRGHNDGLSPDKKVGFYGLDVYSLWESMEIIVEYLEKEDPEAAAYAKRAVDCFEPYGDDGSYAAALGALGKNCKDEVVDLLREVRERSPQYQDEREAGLNAEMNALVTRNAERYYRTMATFGGESWNVRDRHMVETLDALMDFHGPEAKVVVWEHNTHIGDARYTDMANQGLFNVGQLVRQQHQDEGVVLVGFGSYRGSVIAGRMWGAEMEAMEVPPARADSVEGLLHEASPDDKLLIFDGQNELRERFDDWLPHRAIGVVYRPDSERGNFVPTRLASRYDAFLYLEETSALHPMHLEPDGQLIPETFPFGI